jgi:hypothetical protein
MTKSNTPSSRSTLVTVVLLGVALVAVYGALNSYQVSAEYARQFPDAYGGDRARIRFAPLESKVPANGELGYFTDLDPSQPAYAPAFLAAQYAVAPRILSFVDAKTTPDWAVGNFSKPQDYASAGAAHGYSLVADLGNGVVLFRRPAAKDRQ